MAAQERGGGGGAGEMMRDYRKGNWTVQETMILIEAKRMDDERRKVSRSSRQQQQQQQQQHPQPPHHQQQQQQQQQQPLRWKWVEEYCWRRGCQRSQNQCNDKWDNLMRDYKKVREYQRNLNEDRNNNKSYWEMDRVERKEKGLPTNMLPQIYQALYDVVERPGTPTTTTVQLLPPPPPPPVVEIRPVALLPPPPTLPLPPSRPPLPPPPLSYYSHQHVQAQQEAQPSPASLDSESEHSHPESPAKRRRSREEEGRIPSTTPTPTPTVPPLPTTTPLVGGPSLSTSTADHLQEVGNAISRSATMIAEAIQASEDREERRHREIVNLHQTSLRLQESRTEMHRQGLNALTDAINNLANSILHWANSQKNQGGGPSSS